MLGYKTFTVAVLMLLGTVVLIAMHRIDVGAWQWAVGSAAAMMGIREVGDKLLKPFTRGPSKNEG